MATFMWLLLLTISLDHYPASADDADASILSSSSQSSSIRTLSLADTDGDGLPDDYEAGSLRFQVVYVPDGGTITWADAKEAASKLVDSYGVQGHLATITSSTENSLMLSVMSANVQGSDQHGCWLGGQYNHDNGGWEWVTGEVFTYTFWSGNEPNNIDTQPEDDIYVSEKSPYCHEFQFNWIYPCFNSGFQYFT